MLFKEIIKVSFPQSIGSEFWTPENMMPLGRGFNYTYRYLDVQ
jgi:hypothetical protein